MLQVWIGKKVRLRALRPDDVDQFATWDDDSEMQRLSWQVTYPVSPEWQRRRVEKQLDEDVEENDNQRLVIEALATGEFVGLVGLHGADRRHRMADLDLSIGDRRHWGHGYGSEATRLLLRYAFRELGYEKINLDVYAFNTRAIGLYEHLGFQHEGRIRSSVYTAGQRWDELLMGMTRAEYEALHPVWFPDAEE